jgi:hypothetical protein
MWQMLRENLLVLLTDQVVPGCLPAAEQAGNHEKQPNEVLSHNQKDVDPLEGSKLFPVRYS